MITLDKFLASWLDDLTDTVQILGSRELHRLHSISTVRTEDEKNAIVKLEDHLVRLTKYKVEEVKDGESIED